MGVLRRFARANIAASVWLEKRFPTLCASQLGGSTYLPAIRALLEPFVEQGGCRILEVGGIDRPVLERSDSFVFAGLDIERKERCFEVYDEFTVQSVEEPIPGEYDVIYSVTVLEHVPDNRAAARSMYGAQAPGGLSAHYVPCMNHPYALLLRIVGNKIQRMLLGLIADGEHAMGGYPTYFDRCTPARMEQTFREAGYGDVAVSVWYSPTPYFRAFVPAHVLMLAFMHLCRVLGWRSVCSGFLVVARRGSEVA